MSIFNPSSPLFKTYASVTIFTFVLSLGMSLSIAQLRAFWQQKGLMFRMLIATVVLPPVLLALSILAVDLPKPVPIALALLMAAPSPPLLTQRVSKAGVSRELALSIQLTLALTTVVVTPLILSLFEAGFPNASDFRFNDIWGITKTVALVQFLPLGIGFAIHQIQAEWVEKLAKILSKISQVLLLILVLVFAIFIVTSKLLLSLGWSTFLIIALFNVLLLAIGHFIAAGYTREFQTSVAISAIARNLGLAVFIAASIGRADAVLTIFAAQIIGIIVNLPYTQYMKRSAI
jgi:predicted Na+-dependent transporter